MLWELRETNILGRQLGSNYVFGDKFRVARHTLGTVHVRAIWWHPVLAGRMSINDLRDILLIELLCQKRGAKNESKTYV